MAYHPMFIFTLFLHAPINEHCWKTSNILMYSLCAHVSMAQWWVFHPSRGGVSGESCSHDLLLRNNHPTTERLKLQLCSEAWLVLRGALLLGPHSVAGKRWSGLESPVGSSDLTSDAWAGWLCDLGPDSISLSPQPLPVASWISSQFGHPRLLTWQLTSPKERFQM